MIKVQFVLIEDDRENILLENIFDNADSMHDSEVSKYVYENVLDLDNKYDFIYNENSPLIEIKYFNNDKIIYIDDCDDYMYNL